MAWDYRKPPSVLTHSGVKGMRWGTRNGPPYTIRSKYDSPDGLSKAMKGFSYKNFDKLMSPEEVEKSKSGSCHDQTMYAMQELQRMGYDPKALFIIEADGEQGGMTHSFAYYEKDGKTHWFENAWTERAGDTAYDSLDAIKDEIRKAHESGEYGDKQRYNDLIFGKFDPSKHTIGEDLGDFVNICLDDEED